MALLGSLVVKIAAETGLFEDAMDRASRQAEKRAAAINKSLKTIGIGAAALGGGIALAVKSALDNADRFEELSQKTGVAVEDITSYSLALKTSGLDSESFASSLGKLNKAIFEGNVAFGMLGVALTDSSGKVRTTNDVFLEVADRFSALEDGAEKSALAQKLFGKSGADLIPVLNAGKAGLKASADEAARLGLVLSTDTAKQAAAVSDQLDMLSASAAGSANQMLSGLLPSLISISGAFSKSAEQSSAFETAGNALGNALRGLTTAGTIVGTVFDVVGDTIGMAAAAAVSAAKGDFEAARNILGDNTGLEEALLKSADRINAIWTDAAAKAAAMAPSQSEQLAAPVIQAKGRVAKGLDEIEQMVNGRQSALVTLAEEIAALKFTPEQIMRDELLASGGSAEELAQLDALIKKRDELAMEKDIGLRMDKALAEIKGTDEAYQSVIQQQEAINRLFAEGRIDAGEYADAIAGIDESFQSFNDEIAKSTNTTLTEFGKRAASNIQDIAASFFKGELAGKNFFSSILKGLRNLAAELAAQAALNAIFGALAGSGNPTLAGIGSILGGARASGGPTAANSLYQVAENGPEVYSAGGKSYLLTGSSGGQVTSNPAMQAFGGAAVAGGGGRSPIAVEINVDARAATDPAAFIRAGELIKRDILRMLGEQAQRGTGVFA